MLAGESVHALRLYNQRFFDEQIRKVFADTISLVHDWNRRLELGPNAAKRELSKESTLIDLLKEFGPESIRDFKYGAQHALS
jgi:hypothetical protein